MKLHWSPKSPYVRKVMVCAHELGVTERIHTVRSVAAMLKPNAALMHDNPLSKIPTLVLDDGSTLFDSAVICEYLNALAQGSLFPPEGKEKWAALRWHAFADGLLDVLILWRNEKDRSEPGPSVELMQAFEQKARASLRQLESEIDALEQAPFSIAHIAMGCTLGYLDFRFADLNWRELAPALARWHYTLMQRPSFVSTEPRMDG